MCSSDLCLLDHLILVMILLAMTVWIVNWVFHPFLLGVKIVKSSRYVPPHERGEFEKPVRRSQRVRYPVERLTYSGFSAKHFAYMAKVMGHIEPSRFDDAVRDKQWQIAMDEEMDALALNQT